jgi:hypothetical protein
MKISFECSKKEMSTVDAIVTRAETMYYEATGLSLDRLSAHMDIIACHANGCPLKLSEMLAADDENFGHDFFGIARHVDRTTGKLVGGFLPRFAR